MKVIAEKNEKVAQMIFASIYPHYVTRIEKNGRTKQELHQIITWLTGFDEATIQRCIETKITFKTFFNQANIHPNASLIKGLICGYRIEDIPDEFDVYRHCRYLDKMVDELAKGRAIEKILRK